MQELQKKEIMKDEDIIGIAEMKNAFVQKKIIGLSINKKMTE
jgi:hypothetical protein